MYFLLNKNRTRKTAARKAVILEHGGGELANQLWNYVSIYAYCLEVGIELFNPSFFEYGNQFNIPRTKVVDLFLYRPFRNYSGRRNKLKTKLWRKIYKIWSFYIRNIKSAQIVSSVNNNNTVYYLPPSIEKIPDILRTECSNTVYFTGWLFRNPKGLTKYRKEIIEYFKPIQRIENEFSAPVSLLRKKYTHIVGVHIRQGDYKKFKNGKFWIEQGRVKEILNEYLIHFNLNRNEVCFVITSDGKIDDHLFSDLNIYISKLSAIHDLFLLSKTNVILGSDSSFGDFASYYGNIPHIIFKNEAIDWDYYGDKKTFFENKYCTMVHY